MAIPFKDTADIYEGCIHLVEDESGAVQARTITRYTGSTKVATLEGWTAAPGDAGTFIWGGTDI